MIELPKKIKVRWGYVVAFVMLLISYFLIFYIIKQLSTEMTKVSHSYTVINNLEAIKGEITDAETGLRGYLLTSDTRFLSPYNSGSKRVLPLYVQLQSLTKENDDYSASVSDLGYLLQKRLDFMSVAITSFQRAGYQITQEQRAKREITKNAMDSIRIIVRDLQEKEVRLMNQRTSRLSNVFNGTEVITIASLVIALITSIYSLLTFNREKKAKEKADIKAASYQVQLEARIAEVNKVNTELQELKSIEKFAATGRISRTIAHEVRNPLTNISLATEQLKDLGVSENKDASLLLDMIARNAVRINQMVSDLLNSTRFAQLNFTKADVNSLIDQTLEQSKDRVALSHVHIHKNYDPRIGEITVDAEKIKLAFLNIIVNAIEAMDKGGKLHISTRKQGNKCIIEFKDNGSGMDEDTLQKLFEPYFTVKPSGNGLGLTNSQNIILNHRGSIAVTSEIDTGSTFTIILNEDGIE